MDDKVVFKKVEQAGLPYVLVGVEENRYELLCEFQAKDGAFQRAYVQENGKDVIIEPGKDNAIIGLFSVSDDKVRELFRYIEATIAKDYGIVCWRSGMFENLLEQASKDGSKYALLRKGIGLAEKVPLFYRQKPMSKEALEDIALHKVAVEYVKEPIEEDLEDEIYMQEPDDDFDSYSNVTQAAGLPEGWKWVDYQDGSGHLTAPDGKCFFIYDGAPYANQGGIEFKETTQGLWGPFWGTLDEFKERAEQLVYEKGLVAIGRKKDMSKMDFYVIDDMKKAFDCEHFDNVASALERFQEVKADTSKFPALGVRVADGSVDLLHGVNGEAVLVPDYRDMSNFSEPMKEAEEDICEAVRWLIEDKWSVGFEYQNSILPAWGYSDVKVLVPLTIGNEPKNSYCNGKVLKATLSSGIDAIDSLYIENHGWVAYNELLKNSKEYAPEGFIKVQQLNVVYVREKNVIGIDGRMDIAPHDFAAMVSQINKPYSLVVYDKQDYLLQYKDKHEFIVASYDKAPDAIQRMNDIGERTGNIPLIVQSRDSGHLISSYNGRNVEDVLDAAIEAANEQNAFGDIKAKAEKERELN